MIRTVAKRGLQLATSVAGPHRWPGRRRDLTVLMYHRILPCDDDRYRREQPGMVVTPETFEFHLAWIKRYFEPVRLIDWIAQRSHDAKKPACAITFDDGWRDNHEFAFSRLRAAGVPATIFLVSDLVGTNSDFWPGRLQRLLNEPRDASRADATSLQWLCHATGHAEPLSRAWSREHVDRLIETLKETSDSTIEQRLAPLERDLGLDGEDDEAPVLLDWQQINAMLADGSVDVGSHTRHHYRLLANLPQPATEDEVLGSQRLIREKTGREAALFCYPNGDRSDEADRRVRAAYRGACLVRRGWNTPRTDPYEIRRVSIHQDVSADRAAFLARASAVL